MRFAPESRDIAGSAEDWLSGNTEPFAPAFEMPEKRSELSWRPSTPREVAKERRIRPRHARTYLIATAIAIAAIGVSAAWAVDSANYGAKSPAVVAAAAQGAPAKATKAKKHKSKKKSSKKSSAKKKAATSS